MPSADLATLSSTSSDLLSLVRRRDAVGWRRFVDLYMPLVYGWCRRAGLEAATAADVVQDVFTKVYGAIDGFHHDRPGDTFRGWLRVVCRNVLNDHFRRNSGAPAATGGSDAQAQLAQLAAAVDDDSTALGERQALARRAAESVRGQFEPRTWQAFWLVAVEQRSAVETAAELGMTPGAVRQAKYMVLRRLREELTGEFDD